MRILNLGGSDLSKRTRIPRPINVAKEQCVMVGVILIKTSEVSVFLFWPCVTVMSLKLTTASCAKVRGCSGSDMEDTKSKIS